MISEAVIVFALLILILHFLSKPRSKLDSAIKGPRGLPLLGNILQLDKLQFRTYQKWATQYGPIYRVNFLTTRMVVLNDHKWIKEMFADSAFSGRVDLSLFDFVGKGNDGSVHGVTFTEGEVWEQMRRFTIRNLRDFGFGKNSMEESFMVEVNELIEGLKETEGKIVENVKVRLILAVVNSLWSIVTGKRYKQNDAALIKITEESTMVFREVFNNGGIILLVPWVAKYFPKISGYHKIRKFITDFGELFKKPVDEHLHTFDESHSRDFIDACLGEVKKTVDVNSPFYGKLGMDNIQALLVDLYNAGNDTTSTALGWLILALSKFTEIQKKFQDEIEAVTGNTRQCVLADRPQMPYTEALLAETFRFFSLVPLGVQHRALQDKEFKGYMIPKGTLIMSNIYFVHHDPNVWGDPETFRPERFLSSDGKCFKKHEALIPFSVGRRLCLGESLARDSLFLFATNLFQRFFIEFDKNGPDHGFEPVFGFINSPKPFNVSFKDRFA